MCFTVPSEYLLSCLRIFTCTVKVPSFLSEDFRCTVRVPSLMHLKSHINRCCQVSPNMLSKHRQSGGVTLVRCLLMYCQSTNNSEGVTLILAARCSPNVLSKYQRSGGVTCWESPNVLSKYQQSSWGSCTCFLSNLLALLPVFYHTSIFI